jgi:Zn-dependent protease
MDETGVIEIIPDESAAPRLSRRAVWVLLLIPVAFVPLYRVTFPHIGLWPAAVIGILSLLVLQHSASRTEVAVARAGIAVVIAVAVLTAVAKMADGLPGVIPKLEFGDDATAAAWWARVASFVVLIVSISLHECAHALSAWYSGDSTARDAGRLSLNPVRHVDLFGTIILPAILSILPGGFVFGWAKPVPVSPARFRNLRRGRLATSAAGVAVNLTLALLFASCLGAVGILLHLWYPGMSSRGFMSPWRQTVLTGLPAAGAWTLLVETLKSGVSLNMILFWLNVLPVPPLDGFGLLEGIAPRGVQPLLAWVRGWGPFLFLALIFTRALDYLLIPAAIVALLLNYFAGAIAKLA